jgi:pentatricopeptide repeat protein
VAAEIAAMAPGTVQLNIFAWSQKFSKYAKDEKPEKVIQVFQQMQLEGMSPDKFTFVPVINACADLGALEDSRLFISSSFKVVSSLMSLLGVAWLTCMQNVGALRMLGECLTRCHLKMWPLGMPSYWDM